MPSRSFRQVYRDALRRRLYHADPLPLRPAVVFAPHQDDETLGCGGTIVQKRKAGVPVWIVFLTDGSKSHRGLIEADYLRTMRSQEARNAGRILGVPEEHIQFLAFPNGELKNFQKEARAGVEELLKNLQPDEVYVPSALDFHQEHYITNEIVMSALLRLKQRNALTHPLRVYDYPVWFWQQWPWVDFDTPDAEERKRLIKRTLRYGFGLAFPGFFRYAVRVHDCLPVKHEALDQYVSQTTRVDESSHWKTLQDVSKGEFLDCFFQDYEVFRVREV